MHCNKKERKKKLQLYGEKRGRFGRGEKERASIERREGE
jgi:hypothetical protein